MNEPKSFTIRYAGEEDPIRKRVLVELANDPSKSLRDIVLGWLEELEQLKQGRVSQESVQQKLDLLLDIHNSYIIQKDYYAVYPRTVKTADMVRALTDEQLRFKKAKDVTT